MSENIVPYGTYDEETAEKEAYELKTGNFLKIKEGRTIVRFLPPPVGRKSPLVIAHQHWFKSGGQDVKFNCPRYMEKRWCPVCAKVDQLMADSGPSAKASRERAFDMRASLRVYANVIDRAAPEAGPQVLAFGKTIAEPLTSIRKRADDPDFGTLGGDFSNPTESGFDIGIDRKGTGMTDTEYTVTAATKQRPLSRSIEQINEWLSVADDLLKFANVPSDAEIRELLGQPPEEGKQGMKDVTPPAGELPAANASSDLDDFDFAEDDDGLDDDFGGEDDDDFSESDLDDDFGDPGRDDIPF